MYPALRNSTKQRNLFFQNSNQEALHKEGLLAAGGNSARIQKRRRRLREARSSTPNNGRNETQKKPRVGRFH
jgi:hypothetical protein